MDNFKTTERITLKGNFGDGEVRVEHTEPFKPNGIQLVLLHGVYSSANLLPTNKYRGLAEEMSKRGFACWLIETSRKIHNRDDFDDEKEWVKLAFAGKTYKQELDDVKVAVREVVRRTKAAPLWLWGFSLGGISAAACAADRDFNVDRLIVAGSGLYAKKKMEYMLTLPIMSTLREVIDDKMLADVKTKCFIAFRGSLDEIFPRSACEKFYNAVKVGRGKKMYRQFEGGDHSLRTTSGVLDRGLMGKMAEIVTNFRKDDYNA